MQWWEAIVLGLVQGLSEFLPISSSGHLILAREILGLDLPAEQAQAFDVAMHAGTLVALVIYFRDDLLQLVRAAVSSVRARAMRTTYERLVWLIALGTLPAVIVGALFADPLEGLSERPMLVASMLLAFSFVFIIAERFRGHRQLADIRWWHALLVGCAQAFALFPGTSRSGATISAGLFVGLERRVAARFSFLLAAPIVFAAFAMKSPDIAAASNESSAFLVSIVLGFVSAAISGFLAVAALLRFLASHSLAWFAAYRIPVALAMLAWLHWR